MNSDIGIIDQQINRVGVIPYYNLRTFNPPMQSESIYSKLNTADFGFVDLQANRIGVIDSKISQVFNQPQGTLAKKIVMGEKYFEIDYNEKNKPYFYENQKIPANQSL